MKYCPNCGSQLYDAAVMCPKCHADLTPPQQFYTVTVLRTSQKFLDNKNMTVYVDNQPYGRLTSEAPSLYSLPAGTHRLIVSYKNGKKSVDFNLQRDIAFRVEINRFGDRIDIFQL